MVVRPALIVVVVVIVSVILLAYELRYRRLQLRIREKEESNRKLATAVEQSSASIVITDRNGSIEYVNPAFSRLTGYSPEETLGNNPRILKADGQNEDFYRDMWKALLHGDIWRGEFHNRRKDGSLFWESASIAPITDDNGAITHFVAVKEDVTQQKELMERLEQMAQFDMLTGLPNRRMFLDRLVQGVAVSRRNNKRFALLFIDLDGFKRINDSYGHESGDRVLKIVAARLSACVRISDVVGRIGGDEFTLLLGTLNHYEDSGHVAEKVLAALEKPVTLPDGTSERIGASIGISVFPDDADDGDRLLIAADHAMYEAKRGGKGKYRHYSQARV